MALIFIIYGSYKKYGDNVNELITQNYTEAAAAGKSLTKDCFFRLSSQVGNLGQVLSIAGSDKESISQIVSWQIENSQADAGTVLTSEGSLVFGDAALSAPFLKTEQKAISSCSIAISDMTSCSDGETRFAIAAPYNMDGKDMAIAMFYPQTVLSQLFENEELGADGRFWLADGSGKFVAGDSSLPTWVKDRTYTLDVTAAEMGKHMDINSSIGGADYYVYASKVGFNELYAVYMVPQDAIDEKAQAGLKQILIFGAASLIFLLILLVGCVYTYNVRANNLRLYQKKFKIAIRQSARAAFEYNKRTDRLRLISECEHISLPKPYISLAELGLLVHPNDRGLYGQAVAELRIDGTTTKTVRVAHFSGTGDYKWYNVTATRLTDKGEGKALTIGTVEDIDEREKERLVLYERATTDCLTGLCNRAETERTINTRLKNLEVNEHSAFALIDLDDFKSINDEYGHDFGDKALIYFSGKLKATFRFGDVIGRLGGDEFVVYMTLTSDHKVVGQRLKELMESLKIPTEVGELTLNISCSAGCCMASKGDTFDILYRRADNALYESKTLGKAQAIIE